MFTVSGPQAVPLEIAGVPQFVSVGFAWRHLLTKPTSLTNDARCPQFDQDFTVSSVASRRARLRGRLGRAIGTLDAISNALHAKSKSGTDAARLFRDRLQSQRDCTTKPRVARNEHPWDAREKHR